MFGYIDATKRILKRTLEKKTFNMFLYLDKHPEKQVIMDKLGTTWKEFKSKFIFIMTLSMAADACQRLMQEILLNDRIYKFECLSEASYWRDEKK